MSSIMFSYFIKNKKTQALPDIRDKASSRSLYGTDRFDQDSSTSRTDFVTKIIVDVAGRVLMLVRRRSPEFGKLELPGGHIKYGETDISCAYRELYEETGIRDVRLVRIGDVYNFTSNKSVILFYARLKSFPPINLSGEHSGSWYIDIRSLPNKDLFAFNQDILIRKYISLIYGVEYPTNLSIGNIINNNVVIESDGKLVDLLIKPIPDNFLARLTFDPLSVVDDVYKAQKKYSTNNTEQDTSNDIEKYIKKSLRSAYEEHSSNIQICGNLDKFLQKKKMQNQGIDDRKDKDELKEVIFNLSTLLLSLPNIRKRYRRFTNTFLEILSEEMEKYADILRIL